MSLYPLSCLLPRNLLQLQGEFSSLELLQIPTPELVTNHPRLGGWPVWEREGNSLVRYSEFVADAIPVVAVEEYGLFFPDDEGVATNIASLYPRVRENDEIIERYRGCIENLPPIVVARGRVLVDGFHRWQAHRREGIETVEVEDLGDLTDIEILRESIRRNCTHGFQLEESDKKKNAVALWRSQSHLDDTVRYQDLMDLFSVKKRTVEAWTKKAREEEKEEKKDRVWNLWLDCWTQEEIAETLRVAIGTVNSWIFKMRKDAENEDPPASRQHFDVWNFHKLDDSAGGKIFGRMPAQVVEDLLTFLYFV